MKLPFSSKVEWAAIRRFLADQKKQLKVSTLIQEPWAIGSLYLVCLIPFFLLLFSFKVRSNNFDAMEAQIDQMEVRILRLIETQKEKNAFFNQYQNSDPTYLDHTLEAVTFLRPEVEALKLMENHPAFQSCQTVKSRLDHLIKGKNRLLFSEERHQVSKFVSESELKQLYPVEVTLEDLKNLLTMIEDVEIGSYKTPAFRPQLVVQSFHLQKKDLAGKETYFLDMNLVRREPIKK